MKQGDVYLVNLDPQRRTEVGKVRPALIISVDEMNDHAPRVIIRSIDKGRLKEKLGHVDRITLRTAYDLAIRLISPPKE